jgi:pimeloyl-ACP methyl ester carboxylesterase
MDNDRTASPGPSVLALGKGATVWVAGEGEPLVLLHGWALRPHVFISGLERLASRGFHVAAPSLAVVGRRWDLERAVHRVEKTLDHLEWDRAIIVGYSLGGAVATAFAAALPERVRMLTLVNSVGLPLDRSLLEWALPFRRYASTANLKAITSFGRNALQGWGLRNLADAARIAKGAALSDELQAIRERGLPGLVLWGEEDRLLPLEMGRGIARTLGAQLRIVPRADHDWTVRRPELFARELEIAIRSVLDDEAAGSKPKARTRPGRA